MAFAESDRVYIRHFLGFPALFLQADPRLEAAVTAVQALPQGARPDSSTENAIKGLIYGVAAVTTGAAGVPPGGAVQAGPFNTPAVSGLIQVEASLDLQSTFLGAQQADGGEVVIDPVRECARLKAEGRRLVNGLARHLGTSPRRDIFGPPVLNEYGDSFYSDNPPYQW